MTKRNCQINTVKEIPQSYLVHNLMRLTWVWQYTGRRDNNGLHSLPATVTA